MSTLLESTNFKKPCMGDMSLRKGWSSVRYLMNTTATRRSIRPVEINQLLVSGSYIQSIGNSSSLHTLQLMYSHCKSDIESNSLSPRWHSQGQSTHTKAVDWHIKTTTMSLSPSETLIWKAPLAPLRVATMYSGRKHIPHSEIPLGMWWTTKQLFISPSRTAINIKPNALSLENRSCRLSCTWSSCLQTHLHLLFARIRLWVSSRKTSMAWIRMDRQRQFAWRELRRNQDQCRFYPVGMWMMADGRLSDQRHRGGDQWIPQVWEESNFLCISLCFSHVDNFVKFLPNISYLKLGVHSELLRNQLPSTSDAFSPEWRLFMEIDTYRVSKNATTISP